MVQDAPILPDWNDTEEHRLPAEFPGVGAAMDQLSVVGGFAQLQAFEIDQDHTPAHRNCPACKAANAALQAEKIGLAALPFREAKNIWAALRGQSTSLRPRTHETDLQYLEQLGKFFDEIRLRDITPGHLRAYQLGRHANRMRIGGQETQPWSRPCGHSIINHELSVLARILKHCRLWAQLKPYYFPLRTPKWSPRTILDEQEEEQFFRAAAADPDCGLAYWVAAITANTSASGIELRGLRLKHIFLRAEDAISEIYVPEDAVKNSSRPRKIPLNRLARWAVEQCYKRALRLGSCEPDHYLFPFRDRRANIYVPAQPPSRWVFRLSWEKLRRATGFHQVKPHDFRFLCVTKLLENGVAPETVRAVAGHVSQRMVEYYAKHRREAKFAAVMALEAGPQTKVTAHPGKKAPASGGAHPIPSRKLG